MGLGPGAADDDVLVPVGDTGAGPRDDTPAWRPSRRLVAGGVAGVVAVVALVVVVGPSGPPTATMANVALGGLPDAPTAPVQERWALDLGSRDRLALVDDRVVVVADGADVDDPVLRVTARHVRSKQVLWERELVGPAEVVLVDGRGHATTPVSPPNDVEDGEATRLVAIDAEDGALLWERPTGFINPQPADEHLLVQGVRCTMVEARTGAATWDDEAGRCEWLDRHTAVVEVRGGWEVRSIDGTVQATLPQSATGNTPVAVGDLLALQEPDRVVVFDRSGQEQWSAPITEPDSFVRPLGDLIVATSYGGREPSTRAWDLQGEPVDLDVDGIEDSLALEVDGRRVAVMLDFRRDEVDTTVLDLDDPAIALGNATGSWVNSSLGPLTSRGLVVVDPDGGEVGLRSWPRLDPVWTTTLEQSSWIADGWTTLQTSSSGLVLAPWREGDGRWTVHAFA